MKSFDYVVSTLILLSGCCCSALPATGDTFGSGGNAFDIEFVTVGDPGNPNDTDDGSFHAPGVQNFGQVNYSYRISKFEISEAMIDATNAASSLGLTHFGYGPNKPATGISWLEAATFVNWLNTSNSQPSAYKFAGNSFTPWVPGDAGYNPTNPFRNTGAKYFLPTIDEGYKAAYYDPQAGVYYDYPTGSDTIPDALDFINDPDFEVVALDPSLPPILGLPYDITNVGSPSPYGMAGQGGNAAEWFEDNVEQSYLARSTTRAIHGGFWNVPVQNALSSTFADGPLASENSFVGFRVASVVPEPSALSLTLFVVSAALLQSRRLSSSISACHRKSKELAVAHDGINW